MSTDKQPRRFKLLKKPIIGYEGMYEVHDNGCIWSFLSNKYIGTIPNKKGYNLVILVKNGTKKNIPVHRLVGLYFVENPDKKPHINHKNGIRNDNRPINLEWCTPKENVHHAFRTGLTVIPKGKDNPMYGRRGYKSNKGKEVLMVNKSTGVIHKKYGSAREASKSTGIGRCAITSSCRGKSTPRGQYIWQYSQTKKSA